MPRDSSAAASSDCEDGGTPVWSTDSDVSDDDPFFWLTHPPGLAVAYGGSWHSSDDGGRDPSISSGDVFEGEGEEQAEEEDALVEEEEDVELLRQEYRDAYLMPTQLPSGAFSFAAAENNKRVLQEASSCKTQ